MNKWSKSILAGLIIATLIYTLYYKLAPGKHKGQYKVHYLIEAIPDTQQNKKEAKEITGDIPLIVKQRIRNLGYIPKIKVPDNNRLDITVAHVRDTLLLSQTIMQSNRIEFREVYTLDDIPGFFEAADKATHKLPLPGNGEEKSIYTFLSPMIAIERAGVSKFPSAIGAVNKKDTAILSRILREPVLLQALPADLQFRYGILTDEGKLRNTPDDVRLYAIKTKDENEMIRNDDIENAALDYREYTGQPAIFIRLNKNGRQKWEHITNENVGKYIAIILDGIVVTAPVVNNPIHSSDIRLNTRFTLDQAQKFSEQLTTGLLSVNLKIVKSEIASENSENGWTRILISFIAFAITAGLTMLVFNSLKNR
jgi:preprotein translocase subunit SecD